MHILQLPTRRIYDWNSFHDVCGELFGFPAFYGRNMDAWIDCLTYLDDPAAGMTQVHVAPGEILTLELEEVTEFSERCPEQYAALLEGVAFVNWRRLQLGQNALLALAFYRD